MFIVDVLLCRLNSMCYLFHAFYGNNVLKRAFEP